MIYLLFLVLVEDGRHKEEDRVTEEPQEAALQNKQVVVGELSVT